MVTLYILLGVAGAGRREILLDLLQSGADVPEMPTAIYLAEGELPSPADEAIASHEGVTVHRWSLREEQLDAPDVPEGTQTAFLLADGRGNPADLIEASLDWIERQPMNLGRILTVVDCGLVSRSPGAFPWYEACIHFSDVVLLNRRETVMNKWIREFQDYFHKACYPSLFEFVKQGRVANPSRLLFPEPRRLSHVFDDLEEREADLPEGVELELSGDFDDEDSEETTQDPYLARLPSGHRIKRLPDIAEFLEPGDPHED